MADVNMWWVAPVLQVFIQVLSKTYILPVHRVCLS